MSKRRSFTPEEPMKKKVLFICSHNSARSQMAEAFSNNICGDEFEAHSAGLEPGQVSPLVIEAMREVGIDISNKTTQAVFDLFKSGELFAYVITVCDEARAERCPIFPGVATLLHWSFPDPSALTGSYEQRLECTRLIRDQIRPRIETWCDEMCGAGS
jgi:arsenate reductase